ncbi:MULTISPECIES: hypothetical protein [Niallia]|uniref:Uncharacterized protein n=1 Tax=Niallia circulans TaxID=1397 RepID=A0A941JP94_NIACI|nr:hypothetical protein [Niallia circulans]
MGEYFGISPLGIRLIFVPLLTGSNPPAKVEKN